MHYIPLLNPNQFIQLNQSLSTIDRITVPSTYATIEIIKNGKNKILNITTTATQSPLIRQQFVTVGNITNSDFRPSYQFKKICQGALSMVQVIVNTNGDIQIYLYDTDTHPAIAEQLVMI